MMVTLIEKEHNELDKKKKKEANENYEV